MKRVAGPILFSIVLLGSASGQSGRRIERKEVPVPLPVSEAETLPDYSESTPQPKRPKSAAAMRQAAAQSQRAVKTAPNSPDHNSSATESGDEVLKVETDLITVPVSVYDRNGLYIPDLRQGDFKIFEDGKEQRITYFGSTEKPFTVVLLLDTSPSTAYRIEEIQESALAFINQLKPQDQVVVIEFDGNTHVLTEATSDRGKLTKAVRRADFGYGTALYDSVNFALRKRLNAVGGRKAIVLFTDGVDTASGKSSYDSTLDLAEESDTLIFPIYYNTFSENSRGVYSPWPDDQMILRPSTAEEYAIGKKYLDELASHTGGRVFVPEATPGGLAAAFEGIAEELRRQYNIGYIPADESAPGQRRTIKVRVNRSNLVVRARDSYIAGAKSSVSPVKQ